MGSNLMTTEAGRDAVREAMCYLIRRRLGKRAKRSFFRAFWNWWKGGAGRSFDLSAAMNVADQNIVFDDEINNLYQLLGTIGCLNTSVLEMNIYVDPINGSDVTGSGTSALPYASLWFLKNLPRTINDHVRVILMNNLTTTDNINLNLTFGPYGSFAIIGGVAPVHVVGPLSVTNYGVADGGSWINEYETSGVFLDDQYWGDFIQFPTGTVPNECAPIHMVRDTNKIRAWATALSAPPFDFHIIRPAVTLSVPAICINARGPNFSAPSGANAKVFLGNLNIDIQSALGGYKGPIQLLGDCAFVGSFLRILTKSNLGAVEICTLGGFNGDNLAYDQGIDTYALTGIPNLVSNPWGNPLAGTIIISTDGAAGTDNIVWLTGNSKAVQYLDTRGRIVAQNWNSLAKIVCGMVRQEGDLIADTIHFDGSPGEPCLHHVGNFTSAKSAHFSGVFPALGSATHCLAVENLGQIYIEGCKATTPTVFSGYGLALLGGCTNVLCGDDPASIIGTAGAIYFGVDGIAVPWPAFAGPGGAKTDFVADLGTGEIKGMGLVISRKT